MKSALFFMIIIFTVTGVNAQQENVGLYAPKKVRYFKEHLNFMDADGKNRVDVFIQVPFNDIQFIRTANGYEGGYSATFSVYTEDGETLLFEKMWSEKITASTFKESSSKKNFNISFRSFNLDPGKYFVKTTYMDKDSRTEYATSKIFEVKDFSEKPALSDIMLVSQNTTVDGQNKMIPNVSENVLGGSNEIQLYFEIYVDSLTTYNIGFRITNKDGDIIDSSAVEQLLDNKLTKVYHIIDGLELGLGKYTLIVDLMNEDGEIVASTTKKFRSRQKGLSLNIDNIDDVIAQVVYIASPEEMEVMKAGKDELEKTKRFFEFWKTKDPSPGNDENEVFDEYFARVAYSNEFFSNYFEGWRSDRGMVFITLGAPNNIDRHPFAENSKPYEIWYYYELSRSFTFVDETGFGDYRLITQFYQDLFKYRY